MSGDIEVRAKPILPGDVEPEIDALCQRFGIRSLVLFGSANTSDFDPECSDIDLIAEYEDARGIDRVRAYSDFKDALETLFGRRVDLLTKAPIRNPYLRRSIENNHRQIFPRGSTSDRVWKRVWDAEDALGKVVSFVAGQSFDDFVSNDLVRSAVERQLEIAGEALRSARQIDASLLADIPELSDVVGLRNRLAHEYSDLDLEQLWTIAQVDAPKLRTVLAKLLPPIE